ncbi:hypothetical protein [Methanobrevibacter sp. DSM 116169]|uniref:hypothetical protein n=1 Tax=Methanobrevibacter sp. DSM 116169 TaxID=3242727 RepID=UPI0038FC4F47
MPAKVYERLISKYETKHPLEIWSFKMNNGVKQGIKYKIKTKKEYNTILVECATSECKNTIEPQSNRHKYYLN